MNHSQTMQTPKSISDLKAKARESFLQNIGPAILTTLLYLSASFSISSIVALVTSGTGIVSLLMYYILGILSASVTEILRFGICYLYIQSSCHRKVRTNDIFYAFRERSVRILPAALLLGSFSFLCLMPFQIYSYLVSSGVLAAENVVYIKILLAVTGLILYYVLFLTFSMTYYIMIDFPNMPAVQAMKMSVWLMNGHKLRFLLLLLSFLPMQLLGLFSCGIGLIFVYPYIYSTEACFYLNLTTIKANP